MPKVLSFIFAILILFQSISFEADDLLNIGTFMEHAQFHKKQYGDSFLQFLAEHYGNSKEKHMGDHSHDHLPFQHDHQVCSHFSYSFTYKTFEFQIPLQDFSKIPFNFFYQESHSLFEKHPLLQPPKTA